MVDLPDDHPRSPEAYVLYTHILFLVLQVHRVTFSYCNLLKNLRSFYSKILCLATEKSSTLFITQALRKDVYSRE
jgi:hypothetical protein